DPDYLAEWTASAGRPARDGTTADDDERDGQEATAVQAVATLEPTALPATAPQSATASAAMKATLRPAGLAEPDPSGFLSPPRRQGRGGLAGRPTGLAGGHARREGEAARRSGAGPTARQWFAPTEGRRRGASDLRFDDRRRVPRINRRRSLRAGECVLQPLER